MLTKIYLLESLKDGESQTGTRLYQNSIEYFIKIYSLKVQSSLIQIASRDDLFSCLKTIENEVDENDEIILHVEGHGNTNDLWLKNDETISWTELTYHFRLINKKTVNSLHINIAACFGMHLAEDLNYHLKSPYKSYTASQKEISNKTLDLENNMLYRLILTSNSVYDGFRQFEKDMDNHQLKTKDVAFTLSGILYSQIIIFKKNGLMIKHLYDRMLGLEIDLLKLNSFDDIDKRARYVISLFLDKFMFK